MQIGQLASSMSQLQSAGSGNLPSQIIPNPKGRNTSVVMLRSGRELPQQSAPQHLPRPADIESKPKARPIPLSFPTQTASTRKSETDKDLLKMFRRVEINIPLLDSIKQVPKYAKFLNELYIHKRKKIKGGVETGGVVLALVQNEGATTSFAKEMWGPWDLLGPMHYRRMHFY
ncbi:hypothetical protein CR513_16803, partial [Mucuna pruriens]